MFKRFVFPMSSPLLLAGLFFFCSSVLAQNDNPIVLTRINSPIKLDGLSNEPAWESVQPFYATQFEPNNGAPASERTEFRVAYDSDYMYFSLRAYDSDPDGLRVNTLYRDRLRGDDHFEFLIDTFNDNETAFLFSTTPAGIRKDSAISNDASGGGIIGGNWINSDFNTFWDVKTAITNEGWFAEVRIPFSSLRFQEENGQVIMGILLQRKVARKTERLVFPPVPPVANYAFLKPSLAQKVILRGIHSSSPVYVTPYSLGGLGHLSESDSETALPVTENTFKRELGGDLKYSLSNSMTLDLTVNTDFAQVEADDKQVNLTRFSLFFPEKRQFFQERSSMFDFRMGTYSRLFHSRRIGLTDEGVPVRILGGARLVGRMGPWDVGLLNMQTADSDLLPSENFGVLRLRRQVLNDYSYAGAMATSRVASSGHYNYAYGLDGLFRLFGDDYLTLQWSQTLDKDKTDVNALDAVRYTIQIERRRRQGFGYSAGYAVTGPDYDPGIGFTQRTDFNLFDNAVSYTWIPGEDSELIWHTLSLDGFAYKRNLDGRVESAEIGPEWSYGRKSGVGGGFEAKISYEDLLQPFQLSDKANIPMGTYTFWSLGADYHMTHTSRKQILASANVGRFYDGWKVTMNLEPRWYVSPHLELYGEYIYNRVRFPDRSQKFDSHTTRIRISTALNTKLSTNAFIQYNSSSDAFSTNVRFRYNFSEGNDLWLVYNEDVISDLDRLITKTPRYDNRTFLAKYTYALRF